MSDIVERLKSYRTVTANGHEVHHAICSEAAAKIESLRRSNAELQEEANELVVCQYTIGAKDGEITRLRAEVENYHKYSVDYMAERNGRLAAEAELANARNAALEEAATYVEQRNGSIPDRQEIALAIRLLKAEGESR